MKSVVLCRVDVVYTTCVSGARQRVAGVGVGVSCRDKCAV